MLSIFLKEKKYSELTIYLLIVILPFTLVSGPFLSDLSISLITIIFIYLTLKKKLYFYYSNKFTKIFALFFLFLLFTSLFSLDPIISLKKTIFFFRFWIFALAVWYIFDIAQYKLAKSLILNFTIIFLILILDGYFQFLNGENILGWPMHTTRVSSLFKDELILGSYLSRLLPIYFAFLIYTNFEKKKIKYILFFIIFVAVETLTFLSGERVAFFFVNAATLMLILTMKDFKLFRLFSVIVSVSIIIMLANAFPDSSKRIVDKTITQMGFSVKKSDTEKIIKIDKIKPKKYVFSVEHQNHYTSALRMFKDNIYTGIGPRMFRYVCGYDKYKIWEGCSTHPHNTYIQLLSETGLFGFIFGILIFLYVFLNVIKHWVLKIKNKKYIFNDFQLCLLSAILISIWPFVPTGGFFNNWLNIIYFFPVGFFLSTIYKDRHYNKII